MTRTSSDLNFPPACERTLKILEYVAMYPEGRTIREISEFLEIPIASSYRLVNCMLEHGVLRMGKLRFDCYKLGYKINAWASSSFGKSEWVEIARAFMKSVVLKTGQACQLCVLSYDSAIVIAQELPVKAVTVIAELGEKIPINISAGGKVLLSLLDSEKREQFLKKAWHLVCPDARGILVEQEDFKKLLDKIRLQKYSVDYEEYALGIGCLAVPLVLSDSEVVASLGITGKIDFYTEKNISDTIVLLNNCCNQIADAVR